MLVLSCVSSLGGSTPVTEIHPCCFVTFYCDFEGVIGGARPAILGNLGNGVLAWGEVEFHIAVPIGSA